MSWMILLALVAGLGIFVLVVLALSPRRGPKVTTVINTTKSDEAEK